MSDPLASRAKALQRTLLVMERDADAEDFDVTYWQRVESAFAEKRYQCRGSRAYYAPWESARERCAA